MDGSRQLPAAPELDLPELLGLSLPKLDLPAVPELDMPAVPGLDLPELLGLSLPKLDLPAVPGLDLPELLGFSLPNLDLPAVPGLDLPELLGFPLQEPPKSSIESRRNVSLEFKLAAFEPAFADQFRGARLRSEERGPDWLTQAATSYRKLLLGLLHAAAPDELVLPWVQSPRDQLDQRGHPKRRTKIDWLCSSIQDKRYRRFVRIELYSALEVLDLLNRAVHANEFPELEETFMSVDARMAFAIRHISRLYRRRSR